MLFSRVRVFHGGGWNGYWFSKSVFAFFLLVALFYVRYFAVVVAVFLCLRMTESVLEVGDLFLYGG